MRTYGASIDHYIWIVYIPECIRPSASNVYHICDRNCTDHGQTRTSMGLIMGQCSYPSDGDA